MPPCQCAILGQLATCEHGRRALARKPRRNDEAQLMHAIHDTLVQAGVTLWRNNCGVATHGGEAKVRYGLGLGSADLVGLYKGRFVAVEVKSPTGRVSPEQEAWGRCVVKAGGVYVVARTVEEACNAIL
jgi:hypothetical protein